MKKILGALFLLVLIAGGTAAFFLSQRQQDIRQEASTPQVCSTSGADIMLVIDISGSMLSPSSTTDSTPRMTREKEAANIFVDNISTKNAQLPADRKNKVGLSTISRRTSDTVPEPSKLISPMTENIGQVKSAINSLTSIQNNLTCIECGIVLANNEITANGRGNIKKVVVLMTDGRPNQRLGVSKTTEPEAEQAALQAAISGHNSKGTVFYVIGLGTDVNTAFLTSIAQQTGGKYYYAPTANDLDDIYRQIEETLGKGTISGTVYRDTNGNKTKDTDEAGLPGWTVNLKKTDDSSAGSAQTTATGEYILESICDGGYKVELAPQSGWEITSPTNPSYHTVTIQNGIPVDNINFGVNQAPTLTLTGNPLTINSGETSTLTWTSTNTTSCTASNGWTGTKAVSGTETTAQLTQTSTFVLSCTGPSGTVEKTVTVTVQQPATPTPTSSPVPTVTPTPTAVPPTNTPMPTATPIPQGIRVSFSALLDGIGSAGDSQNPTTSTLSNKNPLHPSRTAVVEAFDANNQKVAEATGALTYDAASGKFLGQADFGTSLTPGDYLMRVKTPQYLKRSFRGISTLVGGDAANTLPEVTLIAGDVNGDNVLNILDYNLILGCYSGIAPAKSCTDELKLATDINDDGAVNQFDYNLFLRELSVQTGD